MKLIKFVMVMTVFWLLCIQSRCKKEPDDRCANLGTFKAGFTLGEMVADSLVETDTIMNVDFQVAVRADLPYPDAQYDSIKWRIGDDPRDYANQKTVKLKFRPEHAGQTFKVTMVAKGKSDFVCPLPPTDDGRDTVVKYFTIACNSNFAECKFSGSTFNKVQSYIGKWRGSDSDNPNHEFDVQIVDLGNDPNTRDDTMFYNLRIYNLSENCGGPQTLANTANTACGGKIINPFFYAPAIEEYGYNAFSLSNPIDAGCCPLIKMFGIVDKNDRNKIIIYQIPKATGIKKTFVGHRL